MIPEVTDIQYAPENLIIEQTENKLLKMVKYAYKNIPYYNEAFKKNGISIEGFKSAKDLLKLPVLTKREIINNEKNIINPNYSGKLYHRKTGGSTGLTLHFSKEPLALAYNDAIMYRCYQWYGIDIGDKQARFWGVPVTKKLKLHEKFKDFILNRIRISAFEISEKSCLKQYEQIKRFKPKYFYGYTTAIYGFCLFMKKSGIDLNKLNLKAVICTAEKMYPHHKKLFDEVFDCPVVDEYGSTENGIISFQCSMGNMHMMTDHMYIEFLDEDNNPVNPGESGKIVITDLVSFGMPMIRYDIGDVGSASDKKCDCGINLPLMKIIEGRKEDFIKTNDEKLVHAAYLCYTLKDDAVEEFKMYQKDINQFKVQIVKSPTFNNDSEKMLTEKLMSKLNKQINIEYEYLTRIPREKSGKLRYFVSEMKN